MIVCICHNINERTISSAIQAGANNIPALQAHTGAGTCCGTCQSRLESLIEQHAAESHAPASTFQVRFSGNTLEEAIV